MIKKSIPLIPAAPTRKGCIFDLKKKMYKNTLGGNNTETALFKPFKALSCSLCSVHFNKEKTKTRPSWIHTHTFNILSVVAAVFSAAEEFSLHFLSHHTLLRVCLVHVRACFLFVYNWDWVPTPPGWRQQIKVQNKICTLLLLLWKMSQICCRRNAASLYSPFSFCPSISFLVYASLLSLSLSPARLLYSLRRQWLFVLLNFSRAFILG